MSPPLEEHDYIGLSEVSSDTLTNFKQTELRLGLPGSEFSEQVNGSGLALGINLNVFGSGSKRGYSDAINGSSKWGFSKGSEVELFSPKKGANGCGVKHEEKKLAGNSAPAAKTQVVGWPPIRNSRKNILATSNNQPKNKEEAEGKQGSGCLYMKVSMDGAPYLRKVDLKTYSNYKELASTLEKMFSCFTIVAIDSMSGQCGSHGIPTRDGLSDGSENVLTYEDKDGDWMLVGDVPWDMFVGTCKRLRIMKGSDAIGLAPRAMEKNKNRN